MAFPLMVNASVEKLIPLTEMPVVKLLFKIDPAVPAPTNTHESPEAGGLLVLATFQLAQELMETQ